MSIDDEFDLFGKLPWRDPDPPADPDFTALLTDHFERLQAAYLEASREFVARVEAASKEALQAETERFVTLLTRALEQTNAAVRLYDAGLAQLGRQVVELAGRVRELEGKS